MGYNLFRLCCFCWTTGIPESFIDVLVESHLRILIQASIALTQDLRDLPLKCSVGPVALVRFSLPHVSLPQPVLYKCQKWCSCGNVCIFCIFCCCFPICRCCYCSWFPFCPCALSSVDIISDCCIPKLFASCIRNQYDACYEGKLHLCNCH